MQTSLMQTKSWGDFKGSFGWQSDYRSGLLVLKRKVWKDYALLYIPEIIVDEPGLASMASKTAAILSTRRDGRTIFGRAEFLFPYNPESDLILRSAGFVKANDEVQPEFRQEVDLSVSLDEIRAQMKQKGRYNINLAIKKGVIVTKDNTREAINSFCILMTETATRQRFSVRNSQYFRLLVESLDRDGVGGLWLAKFNGKILAAAIVSFVGTRASYLYGASSDQNRSIMAPYLLHFELIKEAKRRGCLIYDFIGVAPPEAGPKHPWAGITRFKKEFGGQTVRYLGSYDLIWRPFIYLLYTKARKNDKR